jgi:formylglycine-generating enzyme required for sulfatase activity
VAGPIDVFISYAHADDGLRQQLEEHLALLKRDGTIRAWHPGLVGAGSDTYKETDERLRSARVVLLLVSASYLASDHLYEKQMMPALQRVRDGTAQVIPVLLRAVDATKAPFSGLTALPRSRVPVLSWPKVDEAWADVAQGIREAIERIAGPPAPGAHKTPAPEPKYEDDESRAFAEQIEVARRRVPEAGATAAEIEAQIRDLRRKMREGGRLRAGDALAKGRYKLIEQIGDGGFASVWKAHDGERGELCAVKVMHPDQARDQSRRERFFRGARVMARLGHEAVVRVLDPGGGDGGYFYFVMELMPGGDLHRAVLDGLGKHQDPVALILGVGGALAEAHEKGLVHRDVKPENILLDASGAPRLTDFDLVAAADSRARTRTRGGLGSYLFMAPEQARSAKEADARADVYSLGMTALFCLYGAELPETAVRDPGEVIAGLSCAQAVKRVLVRAIEVKRERRFSDARAFCVALRAATERASVVAPAPSRRPAVVAAAALAMVGGFGAILWTKKTPPDCKPVVTSVTPTTVTLNQPTTFTIAGSCLPATVAPFIANCANLGIVSTSSSEVKFACTLQAPGLQGSVVKDRSGGAVLHSFSVDVGPAPPAPPPPDAGTCPEGMVPIPEGTFSMGDAGAQHKVKLSAFCMDKTEVTVAAYRQCVNEKRGATQCTAPDTTTWCNWNTKDHDQHPVNCVDWNQADTYCRWFERRLPTEAEWEYAARGAQGRKYPWGDTPPSNQLCWDGEGRNLGKGKRYVTCAVGSYPAGATPLGLVDMAGNVWEWVADWDGPYPPDTNPPPEDPKGPDKSTPENRRVVRGGGWRGNDASWVRAAFRNWFDVSLRFNSVGFRCARGQK